MRARTASEAAATIAAQGRTALCRSSLVTGGHDRAEGELGQAEDRGGASGRFRVRVEGQGCGVGPCQTSGSDHEKQRRHQCVVVSISTEQIEALLDLFPEFPPERVVLSRNGYNHDVFRRLTHPTDLYADRARVLAGFMTEVPKSSSRPPEPIAPVDGFDAVVAFCGRFVDWKRLDALLRAAAIYEQQERRILTLIIGYGPHELQVEMNDLAAQLGLRRTYFLGQRSQEELAVLFNCADVGCLPSYREPFGLVFIECMACGTPVIGVDSGGPRDFVSPDVGVLVSETADRAVLAQALAAAVDRALDQDWKRTKGATAEAYAKENFSVASQVSNLLADVDQLTNA
jgi:glycosyltransferase involved in cell wall biosynthesis